MGSTMGSGFHLPLNKVDLANQPELYFLWVQDGCILLTGTLWTIAYVLYIRQGLRDKSYGMPIMALCANIGWELIYGVFYPLSFAETLTFVPWVLIDTVIVYTTFKFGPEQWKHAPLVANNIPAILGLGIILSVLMHWSFIATSVSHDEAAFWSGFSCQLLLGSSSLAQLMSRNNTSGHSLTIWLCRWIGSLSAMIMFAWRYWHYPKDYPSVGTPMALFIFVSFELVDLTYPFVYASIGSGSPRTKKE